jgi:hypothetical protein
MPQYPASIDLTQPNGIDLFQFEDPLADRFGFSVAAGAAFTAAGQVRWQTLGADTLIEVNVHASSGADMSVLLKGSHALTAGDFLL